MNSETKTVEEKSRIVQAFYQFTNDELNDLSEWKVNEIDTLLEAIEQFLMCKFHSSYFLVS